MENILIGSAIGAVIAFFIFKFFSGGSKQEKATKQSVILMEKIRTVCKLITVEGDFSEIFHYENVKDKWISIFLGKKKALVLIEAKAYVGFDLTKIKMNADIKTKTIILTNFPLPELLSVETDFKYYDKKEGWANPFTTNDLTEITQEAKQHIVSKIPESGLLDEASNQALETIKLIETLVQTINWKVDYSTLLISNEAARKIEATNK